MSAAAPGHRLGAWLDLVRAPAALTVLGDTVAGAAAAGRPLRGRRLALPLASAALYWSGMALNDWADRAADADERPERPLPSGRIAPGAALAAAALLSGGGLALAAFAGGSDALRVAVPLTAAIWAYDTVLKPTRAAPLGMAACRALDVLLGAGAGRGAYALTPALALATHTLGVTVLSRGEVHGGRRADVRVALTTTLVSAALTCGGRASSVRHRAAAVLCSLVYAGTTATAQLAAAAARTTGTRPVEPAAVRTATVAGIHGMVPLQSGLAARSGSVRGAALVLGVLPLVRRLSAVRSPT
ncbi:UbiA family prenyltransferase [Streptomyces ficellus]|uniref:UbiA family prenyltransferase n=1 Tax=Streptomyces ficellus TaxID=1977088 RepID=A0ABT7YZV8_9ACTN|nr:UbiA family prenyltransferase [Streptomyces ficellus]MDN3292772.1 UbiA family prenyltransferase [Streptomyces ficellus]